MKTNGVDAMIGILSVVLVVGLFVCWAADGGLRW